MADTAAFLAAEPRVKVVTLHRYPLQTCFVAPSSPEYPRSAHLLSPASTSGLADGIAPYVALAHARHLPLRIDEINTDSCGAAPGVSNAFASALWALDTLFEMARVGVDGVNIHTYPGATYQLFSVHPRPPAGARRWPRSTTACYVRPGRAAGIAADRHHGHERRGDHGVGHPRDGKAVRESC